MTESIWNYTIMCGIFSVYESFYGIGLSVKKKMYLAN